MKEYLTNRQIAFILFGIIVGYGIMPLAKNIVEEAGTGAWFALLIASAIAMIFTYIFTYLGYVHQNKTLDEYSEILTGKLITFIFLSIFIIYYFFAFTFITRIVSEMIKITLLQKTPVWALSFVILFVSYYGVIKGLKSIARICEIYGLIIIIVFLITILAVFTQGKFINLRPILILEDIKIYFQAIPVTILPLLGMELIGVIPIDRKENTKNIFKYTVFMVGFIGILYILEAEACMAVMGDSIIYYESSFLDVIRRIDIPAFEFLRRLDGVFIIFWLMAVLCTVIIWAYGTIFFTHKYCSKIHFNIVALIIMVLSFIVSRIPKTMDQIQEILKYVGYIGFVAAGVIPIILFIITKIKKYDKNVL